MARGGGGLSPAGSPTERALETVWRRESARIVGALARMTGDLGVAEDAAQEALVEALRVWPRDGVPRNTGAWLLAVAKRRAIDAWRRTDARDERYRTIALEPAAEEDDTEPIDDDILRLVFTACHPVLSRESQVALTLRVVGGLTSEEIARMLLVPVPTVQARITRAKKTLGAAHVPFATPEPDEWAERLGGVLAVVYLLFTEGYAATSGERWTREDLANEALRLGRILAALLRREPEVHGLVALMELQASRFRARYDDAGAAVLLADQDRTRWDRAQIERGRAALRRSDALGRGRGAYALQAAIAECHAVAPSVADTDWERILLLYEALGRLAPNPVVELNRAVALAMTGSPEEALALVDAVAASGALRDSHLVPSIRGELLTRLGRDAEAREELLRAAERAGNRTQRDVLRTKAAALAEHLEDDGGRR
ncbi:sigma-70 family RNA polymerase sigma factor [Microbacterium sp. X-17]|uniref:RNA polymerase sigma factor n=1 Tax=Microbacterium sp. X-17 TaxID=3144404 RepID=UPI0031F4E1CF